MELDAIGRLKLPQLCLVLLVCILNRSIVSFVEPTPSLNPPPPAGNPPPPAGNGGLQNPADQISNLFSNTGTSVGPIPQTNSGATNSADTPNVPKEVKG